MLNFTTLTENCGGDPGLVVELAEVFLQEYPGYVTALDTAMATRSSDGIRSIAHRLRGALSIFDAQTAIAAATRVESLGLKNDLSSAAEAVLALKAELFLVECDIKQLVQDEHSGSEVRP